MCSHESYWVLPTSWPLTLMCHHFWSDTPPKLSCKNRDRYINPTRIAWGATAAEVENHTRNCLLVGKDTTSNTCSTGLIFRRQTPPGPAPKSSTLSRKALYWRPWCLWRATDFIRVLSGCQHSCSQIYSTWVTMMVVAVVMKTILWACDTV